MAKARLENDWHTQPVGDAPDGATQEGGTGTQVERLLQRRRPAKDRIVQVSGFGVGKPELGHFNLVALTAAGRVLLYQGAGWDDVTPDPERDHE
jgi:hypothetical protein